jgi:hypothetical protein
MSIKSQFFNISEQLRIYKDAKLKMYLNNIYGNVYNSFSTSSGTTNWDNGIIRYRTAESTCSPLPKTNIETSALQNTTDAVQFSVQMYIIQTYSIISGSVLLHIQFFCITKIILS